MRLKTIPEDFQVRELLEFQEDRAGEHYVHLLRKEKLSTAEALSLLAQRTGVERAAIAYAGLKDRQAVTEQYVSIAGRAVELSLAGLRVRPVGRTAEPITSRMSRGNAFTIVVRDLAPLQAARLRRSLPSLQKTGLPNYFDDQRFGCLRHGQGFAILQILRGDYEAALHQLVAAPSPRAISGDVKLKKALQLHWGDWETCGRIARGPVYERLFQHLCAQPQDFRGALEHLPLRQRVIHAFAYQSFLWNRAVSSMLRAGVLSAQRLRITTLAGDLLAWKYLDPERERKLLAMRTPLFAPGGDGGSPPFKRAMIAELRNAGLRPSHFRDNEVPGMVWKEEERQVLVKPQDLSEAKLEPDDMNDGRVKATVSFALPRGAYATMVLKRLFAPAYYARRTADEDRSGARGDGARRPFPARDDRRRDGPHRHDRADRAPRGAPWEVGPRTDRAHEVEEQEFEA